MDRYWKCPHCEAILDKGEQYEAETEKYLSSPTATGWVSCDKCESLFDAKDVYGGKYDVAEPSVTGEPSVTREPMVICPKCQTENSPDQTTCSQCGAKLLPGRGALERIGYLIAGIAGVALFIGLAWLFARMEEALPPCCASPITLGIMALGCLIGGLRMAFTRTPEYEKYVKRAERHIKAFPEQALADFTRALESAPEKEKANILKQRGELYARLGRKAEALADLSEYAASPHAHKGAKVVSEIVGVDMEGAAAAPTEQTIGALRKDLMREGTLKAVGYCKRCKDAVELNENQLCSRCGSQVKEARFVKPEDSETELAKLRKEAAARRRKRLIWLIIGGITLFACVLCMGVGLWSSRTPQKTGGTTPTVSVTVVPVTFAENIFSFEYPSNWEKITQKEISTLLKTSLKGLQAGGYDYIGGVYTGGLDNCRGCAQIVIVVAKNPGLTGTLTDEQYEQAKEATEKQMGSRLISYKKTEVSSLPATESVHIGASGQSKLWELIVIPPEPGVAYMFSCSSHKDTYDDFEEVFARAIKSLRIGERSVPTSVPTVVILTPVAPVTTGVVTYTVQAGDTLSKIAKEFGVTVEAIVEANNIEDPSLLQVGQVLIIPVAGPEE
ncbi:MAG: LysM peptidoglycan-binding domain-containing protein [Anaerolineae bacterium]|jgi:LysM repeat protein|nr:LysM peptidoglycan-binding domain-containing protein [Anaerolineae bacterium]MDH7473361.1 LysM peptidoglycan-binding domain-containing protein [Anaerolineae bacterium]